MASSVVPRPVPVGFLRLISGDGFEFIVEEKYATVSGVIKKMLEGVLYFYSPQFYFYISPL